MSNNTDDARIRCEWSTKTMIEQTYHDLEWGVPVYDDRLLFEMLTLEGAQAGLSWHTVLSKRDNYRKAFHHFDVTEVAQFDEDKVTSLMCDKGIIRNRLKIASTISNAKAFIIIQKTFGSFSEYIWQFTDGKPIQNHFKASHQIPTFSNESNAMSKDLKKHGFKFVGSTICYAYMQAIGMVNDHVEGCYRHKMCQ